MGLVSLSVLVDGNNSSEVLEVDSPVVGVQVFELDVEGSVVDVVASGVVELSELLSVEEAVSVSVELLEKVLGVAVRVPVSVTDLIASAVDVSEEFLSGNGTIAVGVKSSPLSVELLVGEMGTGLGVHTA